MTTDRDPGGSPLPERREPATWETPVSAALGRGARLAEVRSMAGEAYPVLRQVVLDTTDARSLAEIYRKLLGSPPGSPPPGAVAGGTVSSGAVSGLGISVTGEGSSNPARAVPGAGERRDSKRRA